MWGACLIYSVGIVVQISSSHTWAQYAVGRLIGGLGVGSLSVAVPMYQAETAPAAIRGTLTATYQLFVTLGILIAYCVSASMCFVRPATERLAPGFHWHALDRRVRELAYGHRHCLPLAPSSLDGNALHGTSTRVALMPALTDA
jgi:MFS family permease